MNSPRLTLNLENGSVSFAISSDSVKEIKTALDGLINSLKTISTTNTGTSKKPAPQPIMEYRHVSEVFLEVFCNPNIWPTPFAAKVLLTIRDTQIKLTTEAELTRVIEDVNQYLEQID